MGYRLFCIIVFIVQVTITIVDFMLCKKHYYLDKEDAAFADMLAGISWGMTACWWLYQAFTASVE